MPPVLPAADTRLLSKVAGLYYDEEMSQQEIADRLRLSRPKISRLLQQARALGVVQIIVHSAEREHAGLESSLERAFGLREAIVVSPPDDGPDATARHLGAVAAAYLQRALADGDVVGLSWGRTVHALVSSVQPRLAEGARVVQIIGGAGAPEDDAHAADVSRRLAQALGSQLTLLPAPWLVASAEARRALVSDPYVRAAFDQFGGLSLAFVGVGPLDANRGLDVEPGLADALREAGAVGDVAMCFFDRDGQPVEAPVEGRTLGISFDDLRGTGRVVGVAGGVDKHEAVRGALRTGVLDVLVTDAATAAAALAG